MSLSVSVTPQPTNDPPRNFIEVTEDDSLNVLRAVRLYGDGVRLRFDPVISGQTAIAYDYDAKFDVPIVYRADADEINTAPEWSETWASLASWLSPPSGGAAAGWAVGAGLASSTVPGAVIYRSATTDITQVDVVAPSNVTVELLDAAGALLGFVKVTPDGMVTVSGSAAATTVAGTGDFSISVSEFSLHVVGTGWEATVSFTGAPRTVLLRAPAIATFVAKYGTQGTGTGQLDAPRGLAFDSAGNFFVADATRKRILKYNSSGVFQSEFGTSGTGSGQLQSPLGIAIDASDNVWVVDTVNDKVLKYNSAGVFQAQYGSSGSSNGQFNDPVDIAFDSGGNFFITDSGNNRVQKFNSSGTYQSQFGTSGSGDGQFNGPQGIAIDSSNNIYVREWGNYRVQKFNSAGTYQSKFGSAGTGNGQFTDLVGWADFIAVDSSGNIYTTDGGQRRIQKFDSSGVFVGAFGSLGAGDGQFYVPQGIEVRSSGDLYVVDAGVAVDRVQKFTQAVGSVDDITVLGSGLPVLASATDTETLSPTGDQAGVWVTNAAQPELAIIAEASPVSGNGPYFILPSSHEDGEFEENSVALRIEGSSRVVTASLGPRLGERWTLDIGCTTNAARRALESLLADSAAINLRFPGGTAFEELDGGFYAVGRVGRSRMGHPVLGPIHVLSLPLTPSPAPAYKPLWQWNWNTLAQTGMTWDDVNAAFGSWDALLVGPTS